jgi:hypothetical protein
MKIKHPVRKLSMENWKRYGRYRYRLEPLFRSIKLKLGSSFRVVREEIAKKVALACAVLWNFYIYCPLSVLDK